VSKNNPPEDSNTDGTVDKVLNILDKEGQQEKSAFENGNSLLIGKDANLLRKREEEYRDIQKQWVRREVWLKTTSSILKKKRKREINRELDILHFQHITG
jgi:hypothetical protein